MHYKKVITLLLVASSFLFAIFISCNSNSKQEDTTFVSCTFEGKLTEK